MRPELFYNPRLLCERLAAESQRKRRRSQLRGTAAANLPDGHIDTLELLTLAREAGIAVVYDIGANVGTFSVLAKSVIPGAAIHAFEPLPEHIAEFHNRFASATDVSLHPVALGPENGPALLHVTDFSDASSLLPSTEANLLQHGVKEAAQLLLQMHRLDDFGQEHQLPRPDLLKLDVQGYELEVLRGATESLKTTKAVIAEVSFVEYYKGQCLFHDLVAFLAESGLLVRAFGVNTRTGVALSQTDVLFMRSAASLQKL